MASQQYADSHSPANHSRSGTSQGDELGLKTWKAEFGKALDALEPHGEFASYQVYTQLANPGLEVLNKLVPLPLQPRDAENIKQVCYLAPVDRGQDPRKTDPDRLIGELQVDTEHNHFRTTNPAWQDTLDKILGDMAASLGFQPSDITLQPHKLLLYEKGASFRPHKDPENAAGVMGSLSICLPSKHTGGEVHVWQDPGQVEGNYYVGPHRQFSTSPTSPFDLIAWSCYWDVQHEIRPLDFGHLLCLTYYTVSKAHSPRSVGLLSRQQLTIGKWTEQWRLRFPTTTKLVYFLSQKYADENLSPEQL